MTIIFIILFYLLVLITVGIVIINTNTTSKALAYLMLIFLFPIIGVIVYFSIGRNYRVHKMYNKKLLVDRNAFPELEKQLKQKFKQTIIDLKDNLKNFVNLANYHGLDNLITTNNKIELLINGEEKFPEVLKTLKQAKQFIHLEYYIFEDDEIGKQFGEVLKQKAAEGVKVRFIYDDFGSKAIRKTFVNDLKNSGVQAFPFYKIKLLFLANRINYRNHRKIIVVDGNIGYVGGINISGRYTNPNKHKLFWRDTHIKITGSAVLDLQRIFISDWNFCAKQSIGVTKQLFPIEEIFKPEVKQITQIVYSGPDSDHPNILFAMIQAILLSKTEILITTPYFIPNESFINAIKIARLSNVDIKILVPGKSDSALVNAVSNSYYQELLEIGVAVYKYQKGFVHAKTMVCDSFLATVGTANLDQRSFDLNFEVNAFIYDENFSTQLQDQFYTDLKDATKLELTSWKNRPKHLQFTERFARLLSPLM